MLNLITTTSKAKKIPETEVQIDRTGTRLWIKKGAKLEEYDVAEFPTSWDGRAFQLTKKRTGEQYNVFVANNPQDHNCDCTGHESHGHCKHIDALHDLWDRGWLPRPEEETPEQLAPEQLSGPSPFDPHADEVTTSDLVAAF
jgi:hypothetical protein